MESLEIIGPRHSYCRAVVTVAPSNIVMVLDERHARVISIIAVKTQRLWIEFPLESVFGESGMQCHPAILVIHPEHSSKALSIRHNGRIEDAVAVRKQISGNHRITGVSP